MKTETLIQQAKEETAREIFEEIELKRERFTWLTSNHQVCILVPIGDWQSLKAKYLKEAK